MLRGLSVERESAVQATNDDAQLCKLSCTRLGYFQDDFVQHFVRRPSRRPPLINRGYFARYAALQQLLTQFLDATAGQEPQVLVLGGGFDTTWFQLAQAGKLPARYLELDYPEVVQRKVAIIDDNADLTALIHAANATTPTQVPASTGAAGIAQQADPIVAPQASAPSVHPTPASSEAPLLTAPPSPPPPATLVLGADPTLSSHGSAPLSGGPLEATNTPPSGAAAGPPKGTGAPPKPSSGPAFVLPAAKQYPHHSHHISSDQKHPAPRLYTPRYSVLPVDLCNGQQVEHAMQEAGFLPSRPTYILSECVLVYMEPEDSAALLTRLASHFERVAIAIYEQVKPDDRFGQQMVENLEVRGCPLRGLAATPTLQHHCKRLLAAGWAQAHAWDMGTVYNQHLNPEQKAHAERLELFDELEEWNLIQEH